MSIFPRPISRDIRERFTHSTHFDTRSLRFIEYTTPRADGTRYMVLDYIPGMNAGFPEGQAFDAIEDARAYWRLMRDKWLAAGYVPHPFIGSRTKDPCIEGSR